jgi:simple sugar transport system ATP-binding protein
VGVRTPTEGTVTLEGSNILGLSPADISSRGMASIPQDRLKQGLISEFTVQENLILGMHGKPPFCSPASVLNAREIMEFSQEAIKDFEIATMGPEQKVHQLSGGNLQKVILAREVTHPVKAIVASSPTRGLDINATYYVYGRFLELLKAGTGILMISEDLDEIFNLSDRIAVIYNGRIMGVFGVDEVDKEKVGLLMAGIEDDE